MPTTVIIDVDTGGMGGYSSLDAALAAEVIDLQAADKLYRFRCRASGGAADTAVATVSAVWNSDATRKVVLESVGANRHVGSYDTNKYRRSVAHTAGLVIAAPYTEVSGLQMEVTGGDFQGGHCIQPNADQVRVFGCIFKATTTGTINQNIACIFGAGPSSTTTYVYNNLLLVTNYAGGIDKDIVLGLVMYTENNTLIGDGGGNHTFGIQSAGFGGGGIISRNDLVYGFGDTVSYVNTFLTGTDNNTTDSTDDIGTGSNNHTSQTFTFTNAGAGDYSLASGDTGARDQGTTLATVTSGFTDDIVGTARDGSGAIDCGCFEFPSGVAIPVFMNQYRQRR